MTRRANDSEGDLPLSRSKPVADDVRNELEFHLAERTRELEARGMSPDDAMREARETFGDRDAVERECRTIEERRRTTVRRANWFDALRQDVSVGLRVLRKSPGFTFAAVFMLALGIGANSAVFSIVNQVLLRPLPYANAGRIMYIVERHEKGWGNLPWANLVDLKAQSHSFDGMAAYWASPATVLGASTPLRVVAAHESSDFYRVMGVHPFKGRLPLASEHRLGANPVAVVSYAFWRDNLGSPATLDGLRLRMDLNYDVVGVLPEGFDFPAGSQIWTPLELSEQATSRTAHNAESVGLLKPGVTQQSAQLDLDGIFAKLKAQYGNEVDAVGSTVTSLQETLTGSFKTPLYLLLGASAIVLLAACVNIASAMLARGTARSSEFNVRLALGATRARLVRQLVTESALVAIGGAVAGLFVANGMLRVIALLAPQALHVDRVHIDGWVQVFALGIAVVTTLLFGLLPALRLSGNNMALSLREGTRGTSGAGRMRVWNVLVATEVALAVVLLSGSALLIKSFSKVMQNDIGFDASNVVAVQLDLPEANYGDTTAAVANFHTQLLTRLQSQPGIQSVGFSNVLPMSGAQPNGVLMVEGKPPSPKGPYNALAIYRVVGGQLFSALRIPLIKGRTFRADGARESTPSVVVSETFAREQWPDGNAIGKRLQVVGMDRGAESWYTVIGVVGDVRTVTPTSKFAATYYFDYRDRPAYRTRQVTYVLHSAQSMAAVSAMVRREVAAVSPQVPLQIESFPEQVAKASVGTRFPMLVLGAFATVALALAIAGIYAVVSYAVAQRTREIGVRLALGATSQEVRALVLKSAMIAIVPGLAIGAAIAAASSNLLRTLLYGVSPFDPAALGVATVLLAVAALVSSAIPAMRATRVDPLIAMRAE
jgi:putative ABC transport system permease protein